MTITILLEPTKTSLLSTHFLRLYCPWNCIDEKINNPATAGFLTLLVAEGLASENQMESGGFFLNKIR